MKLTNNAKFNRISIAAVLVLGIIIGVLVAQIIKNKSSNELQKNTLTLQKNEQSHPDEHGAEHKDEHKDEHDEQSKIIRFDEASIKQAGIVIEQASPKLIGSITQLNGEIKFNEDRTAHVVPRLGGIVDSVSADMGQQVKKGQILAVISSAQLSELRSALLSTQKRKELAQTTYERERKLWEAKISSEQDYLQAKQNLSEMDIALQNVSQKLFALGAASTTTKATGMLSRYELRAPFDGMIVEKHIAQGEAVKEDANVFTISDLSTVWAEITVPAQDLDVVRVGEKAVVRASTGSVSEGKITFVGSLLGEQTRTAKARATLTNPKMAWRPGLFVSVDLTNNESEVAVAVQSDAIQTINNRSIVFVKVDGGFEAQTVAVGRSDGKYSEINDGLKVGTPYAAMGSFVIKAEQGKSSASHAH